MRPQRHLAAHITRDSGSFPRASPASICHRLRFSLHKVCKAIRVMPMNTTSPNERIISNALNKEGAGSRGRGVRQVYSQPPAPGYRRGTRREQADFFIECCGEHAECIATHRGCPTRTEHGV